MSISQGIKLDETTKARLKILAEKRHRSPHWLMRTAIEIYLEREELYEREKTEDLARWESYVLTGKAVEQEKVEGWLADLANNKQRLWPK